MQRANGTRAGDGVLAGMAQLMRVVSFYHLIRCTLLSLALTTNLSLYRLANALLAAG
jgi:hypothetical protein